MQTQYDTPPVTELNPWIVHAQHREQSMYDHKCLRSYMHKSPQSTDTIEPWNIPWTPVIKKQNAGNKDCKPEFRISINGLRW